jgi:uncharacterized protein (TIGR02145 family)
MKKCILKIHLFGISVFFLLLVISCKKENDDTTVTDIDGNVYNTITIGSQVWLKENLKTTKYNDGAEIPNVIDNTEWGNLTSGAYCWYDNNEATYKNSYGALYNWFAANTNKICPIGYHIPSDAEWTELSEYLGGSGIAGGKLKEIGTTHWMTPNTGATNESNFTALPGGWRSYNGTFNLIREIGYWWSSTQYTSSESAYSSSLGYDSDDFFRHGSNKKNGHFIRCLKN